MSNVDQRVTGHYTTGKLYDRFVEGLKAAGVSLDHATPEDLKRGDEFHTGGVEATDALVSQLDMDGVRDVIDIGSGIGGPSRYFADRFGCATFGVDLTPEFVETARALTKLVGLEDLCRFEVGSATDMPCDGDSADLALLLHVGMNIEDKEAVFHEAFRVLRPGAQFAVFEVMSGDEDSALVFPLPWSAVPDTSFVEPPQRYLDAAEDAGFRLVSQRNRRDFALEFMSRAFAAIAEHGPPPVGIHMMMGQTAGEKLQNYVTNVTASRIAPVEMIFRKESTR